MTTNRSDQGEAKNAVSISEMARMCGLSRQRFGQLVKAGVFLQPLYDVATRRPFYDAEMQHSCLEVRRRNCGINGQVVLFYARRQCQPTPPSKPRPAKSEPTTTDQNADILDGLKSLGLVQVTAGQVVQSVRELYPQGTDKLDVGEVIRSVFLHIRRKNSGEKVGGK